MKKAGNLRPKTGDKTGLQTQNVKVGFYKFRKIVGRADFSDQFRKLSFVTNVLDII